MIIESLTKRVNSPLRRAKTIHLSSLENGLKMACFNPIIISTGVEEVAMKEGCLTFPFVFLMITRPRKCVVKYEDENGDLKEGSLDGMMSRIFQHE